MRKQDFVILLLCGVGLFVLLQQEGTLSLERAFELPFKQPTNMADAIQHELVEHEVVDTSNERNTEQFIDFGPKPIVTDLDGDGNQDLIVASRTDEGRTPMVRVFSLRKYKERPRFVSNDFSFMLPSKKMTFMTKMKRPIAIVGMAVGHFLSTEKEQRIVLVFSNWKIVCLDHELKLIWESRIKGADALSGNNRPQETVISIVPYAVHQQDEGIVVVGLRQFSQHEHDHSGGDKVKQEAASHYSYFAFDGKSGSQRWKHESKDFHYANEMVTPQHNYKIDVRQHTQHSGEVPWRMYRDDVLMELPHMFRHPHNVHLSIEHFYPAARKAQQQESSTTTSAEYGEMRNRLAEGWSKLSSPEKQKKTKKMEVPNVVVAHLSKGIEVVHLYTGRTLCQVAPLKPLVTYVDVNQDGTIDGAEVRTYEDRSGYCLGVIESGAPSTTEVLFKTPICEIQGALSQFAANFVREQAADQSQITSVPPIVIERPEGHKVAKDVLFMVSTGLITAVGYDSKHDDFKIRWQIATPSTWGASSEKQKQEGEIDRDRELEDITYPELVALPLRKGEMASFAIAIGDTALSILDSRGSIQHVEKLTAATVQPVVIADINGDNLLDIIVATRDGYYGYICRTHSGTSVLSVLVLGVLMVICVLYVSTYLDLKDDSVQKNPALKQQ